eukprot:TRINITY_DN5135_c0_g4_i1.p1 TRINITY_DN5135_c0_g4~~TRINITY_DN5135_c0_g4_i1.p1  ORF type:complete len:467 (+),score=37.28 TRINITY_DN5135_c0_g4_i1:198-1403(+)
MEAEECALSVAGSVAVNESAKCACEGRREKVYCGYQFESIAGAVFEPNALECDHTKYCASEAKIAKGEVDVLSIPHAFNNQVMMWKGPLSSSSQFLGGMFGVTHYVYSESRKASQAKLAVVAHGLAKDLSSSNVLRDSLLVSGYRVLTYDLFGHGRSYANRYAKYDRNMVVTQIGELLDHVLNNNEKVDLWVGVATGALAGVNYAFAAAKGSQKHKVKEMVLISPSFHLAQSASQWMLDKSPSLMYHFSTKGVPKRFVFEQNFVRHLNQLFCVQNVDGAKRYCHDHARKKRIDDALKMFKYHPQVVNALVAYRVQYLRNTMLATYRKEWKTLLSSRDAPRTLIIVGDNDTISAKALKATSWAPEMVTSRVLNRTGNEAVVEAPVAVCDAVTNFIRAGAPEM